MTSWYTLPQVEYYAGRYFTHQGVDYIPGDQVPQETAHKFPNLEGAVRGRYLIPICADKYLIPRHLWGEAETYETMLRKHRERAIALNLPGLENTSTEPVQQAETPSAEPAQPAHTYDPVEHTITQVLAYVDAHPEETQRVLEAEQNGKGRTTLLRELEERLTAPEA